jgi:hypothetical protein
VVVVVFVDAGGVVVSLFGPQAAKSPTTEAKIKTFFIFPYFLLRNAAAPAFQEQAENCATHRTVFP